MHFPDGFLAILSRADTLGLETTHHRRSGFERYGRG
jgi:hypothetical protein